MFILLVITSLLEYCWNSKLTSFTASLVWSETFVNELLLRQQINAVGEGWSSNGLSGYNLSVKNLKITSFWAIAGVSK